MAEHDKPPVTRLILQLKHRRAIQKLEASAATLTTQASKTLLVGPVAGNGRFRRFIFTPPDPEKYLKSLHGIQKLTRHGKFNGC